MIGRRKSNSVISETLGTNNQTSDTITIPLHVNGVHSETTVKGIDVTDEQQRSEWVTLAK